MAASKSSFFILETKKLFEQNKNKLKTKNEEWKELAVSINAEFGVDVAANQVENKWRTLKRAYLKAKSHNSRSVNDRKVIDFEEYILNHLILNFFCYSLSFCLLGAFTINLICIL